MRTFISKSKNAEKQNYSQSWPMSVTNLIINLLIYYYIYMFVEFILYSSFEMLQFLHCF